ncbi:hypothetical protein GSH04_06990 [Burkholderia pseudomallei]|nr:hypothetical protein [Burkholderia pseudomallei]MBM5630294.1 hypothetical protein [Burkholderia pseudomallei]MBM5657982.1 hypothetical protein [Burkholderia pseudomallei]
MCRTAAPNARRAARTTRPEFENARRRLTSVNSVLTILKSARVVYPMPVRLDIVAVMFFMNGEAHDAVSRYYR